MKTLICLVLCALVASTYAAPASLEEMQAKLRKMQHHAEVEGFFSSLRNIARKMNGGVEMQQDDDDNDVVAQLQAFLSNMNEAELQSFWKTAGKIGKFGLSLLGKK